MTLSGKIKMGIILLIMLNAFVEYKKLVLPFSLPIILYSFFAPIILFGFFVLLSKANWKSMLKPDWNHPLQFASTDKTYFLSQTFFFSIMMLATSVAFFISSIIFQNEIWKSAINLLLFGFSFMTCTLVMSNYINRIKNPKIDQPNQSRPNKFSKDSPFDLDKLIANDTPEKEITDDDFENLK